MRILWLRARGNPGTAPWKSRFRPALLLPLLIGTVTVLNEGNAYAVIQFLQHHLWRTSKTNSGRHV
jgi:hypothetical protein